MYIKAVEDRRGILTLLVLSVDGLLHKEASHFLHGHCSALQVGHSLFHYQQLCNIFAFARV